MCDDDLITPWHSHESSASCEAAKELTIVPACKCSVDYSLALLILGFVVTLAGQSSTYWLMGRLQRRSIVIIAMALLMLLAALTMYYESIVVFLDALHEHRLSERGQICTEKSG